SNTGMSSCTEPENNILPSKSVINSKDQLYDDTDRVWEESHEHKPTHIKKHTHIANNRFILPITNLNSQLFCI
ncbi:MAG: hypothetical protein WA042_04475, partial [Blautia wexlerae]